MGFVSYVVGMVSPSIFTRAVLFEAASAQWQLIPLGELLFRCGCCSRLSCWLQTEHWLLPCAILLARSSLESLHRVCKLPVQPKVTQGQCIAAHGALQLAVLLSKTPGCALSCHPPSICKGLTAED